MEHSCTTQPWRGARTRQHKEVQSCSLILEPGPGAWLRFFFLSDVSSRVESLASTRWAVREEGGGRLEMDEACAHWHNWACWWISVFGCEYRWSEPTHLLNPLWLGREFRESQSGWAVRMDQQRFRAALTRYNRTMRAHLTNLPHTNFLCQIH